MKKYGLAVVLIILGFAAVAAAQSGAVDSLFSRGVNFYEAAEFSRGLETFELLDGLYPGHAKTTASLLMQGKCHYQLKDFTGSEKLYSRLMETYPNSEYMDDALYGLGTVHFTQGDRAEAVVRFLEVVEKSDNNTLKTRAARLAHDIMEMQMNIPELERLLKSVKSLKGTAAVTLMLAEKAMKANQFQSARSVLNRFLSLYPDSPYQARVQTFLGQIESRAKGSMKLGVILPLSGDLADEGKAILSGIQYAVDLYNRDTQARVDILVEDSGSNIVKAIQAAQKLCGNEEIVALIGELESDITAAVAAVAQSAKVSLLSPSASAEGLASIGDYVFQMTASLKEQMEALVEYAVTTAGMKRFAILAPADPYGTEMVRHFKAALENTGSELLMEKYYYGGEGAKNLKTQFAGIREAGLQRMLEDSVLMIVSDREYKAMNLDEGSAIYVKASMTELVDSTNLGITSIDGLLIPAWTEDLQYIIPQLSRYNVGAQILGGSQWHDEEILENHKTWVDGAIFLSDYYVDPSDYRFNQFRNQFRVTMNMSPEKNEVFGFDTAGLLLNVCSGQFVDRATLRSLLSNVDNYRGIRGAYNLTGDRVNRFVRLLMYRRGNILILR